MCIRDRLNHEAMKKMAESVRGSFSFSILDNNSNLHLIKGDSPLRILHMKKKKLYVYALSLIHISIDVRV